MGPWDGWTRRGRCISKNVLVSWMNSLRLGRCFFFLGILVDPVGGLVKKHDTIFFGQKRRGFGVKSGV